MKPIIMLKDGASNEARERHAEMLRCRLEHVEGRIEDAEEAIERIKKEITGHEAEVRALTDAIRETRKPLGYDCDCFSARMRCDHYGMKRCVKCEKLFNPISMNPNGLTCNDCDDGLEFK